MKSYDYEAVVYDGEELCVECLPEGVSVNDEEVGPIFADSEVDRAVVCAKCGAEHDYMNITGDREADDEGSFPMEWHKTEALMKVLGVEAGGEDVPEYDESTEEFTYGREAYIVLTDEEADERAKANMRETLWAFQPSFLSSYVPALSSDAAQKAWSELAGRMCEGANPIVEGMLGSRIDEFMDDAIRADGRAHFMNTYDDREEEVTVTDPDGVSHTLYVYRMN